MNQFKKRIYVAPETEVTRVEIESAICSGSVDFGTDAEKKITISSQDFASDVTTNDFSNDAWNLSSTSTTD